MNKVNFMKFCENIFVKWGGNNWMPKGTSAIIKFDERLFGKQKNYTG